MCLCLAIMKEEVINLRLSQGEHEGSWKRKKIGKNLWNIIFIYTNLKNIIIKVLLMFLCPKPTELHLSKIVVIIRSLVNKHS